MFDMSKHYDNWERLVTAVVRRERDRQLALCSSISSTSSSFSSMFQFDHDYSDFTLDHADWKTMLPLPPDNQELVWRSAADSDTVWDRFLLSDIPEIVSRSVSPVVYANTKELYFSLCHSPILIDAGKLSFYLEKKSGKKCYMVGAKELGIIWRDDTPGYWDMASHPDSRFSEVALLKSVCWLEIRGAINTRMLSSDTIYGAYLVFKLDQKSYGLESANAFVRFVNDRVEGEDVRKAILDHFAQESARYRDRQSGEVPVRVGDGLTEIGLVHLQRGRGSQQQSGRVAVGSEVPVRVDSGGSRNSSLWVRNWRRWMLNLARVDAAAYSRNTSFGGGGSPAAPTRTRLDPPLRVGDGLTEIGLLHLQHGRGSQQQSGRVAVGRGDGWMEVELGSFFCDGGDDGEVETWLLGADGYEWKSGLIVQGIEFRPKP